MLSRLSARLGRRAFGRSNPDTLLHRDDQRLLVVGVSALLCILILFVNG